MFIQTGVCAVVSLSESELCCSRIEGKHRSYIIETETPLFWESHNLYFTIFRLVSGYVCV